MKKRILAIVCSTMVVLVLCMLIPPARSFGQGPGRLPGTFEEIAVQGLGNRHNTYIWSMVWWRDKLYVGTGRDNQCVQQATGHLFYPNMISYPPLDPDIECTQSPQDLPVQAEIWRYTPQTDTWERLYQSPADVPIQDFPGKFVARDIGFRSMTVFTEPNGGEALYIGGVSSNSYNPDVPGARLLRSTDGVHFAPVPQDPGTFLGDLNAASLRSMVAHDGKLFVVAAEGFAGFGPVIVASNPAGGNNGFQYAFDPAITAFEMERYQSQLYIGTGANVYAFPPDPAIPPFSVLRSTTTGAPPYQLTPVITDGAYYGSNASRSVVSMGVFQGRLYVGTDRSAELLRINPDDSWDLIAGRARWTPEGIKYPLSGLGVGFDNPNNIHVWRLQEFDGWLYVGTMDQSTKWRLVPIIGEMLRPEMGFDLFVTANGTDYSPITRNGFGDIFDVGVRNFVGSPTDLYLGDANFYYGGRVFRQVVGQVFNRFLPLTLSHSTTASSAGRSTWPSQPATAALSPTDPMTVRLVAEQQGSGAVVLRWKSQSRAQRFHVMRVDFVSNSQLRLPEFGSDEWFPGPEQEVGTTEGSVFVDTTAQVGGVYHYYLVADDGGGARPATSNLIRVPSLAKTMEGRLAGSDGR